MSWLLAFAGFAALVILHEFGHFAAAKAVGMRVERFFLFFPPKIASFTRGETEYGVGWIPLGGFVKITGMNPDEELPEEVAARGYYAQPVWKRIVVIGAGPAVNLLIAFVILFFLAFGAQKVSDRVDEIIPGSPAAAQLQPGDQVLAVDGKRFEERSHAGQLSAFAHQVASHECAGEPTQDCRAATPAKVTVVRDGQTLTLSMRPEYDEQLDRTRLGFAYGTEAINPGPGEAATRSLDGMWQVTSSTLSTIGQIFNAEKREEISSIVGGYEVTRQAIEFDSRRALTLLAFISLSLAIINLFPFLPLDGGHIFWSIVEKVRGRPVSFQVMERASVLGFVLVLMLFAVGLSNDIGRLTGEGFNVR